MPPVYTAAVRPQNLSRRTCLLGLGGAASLFLTPRLQAATDPTDGWQALQSGGVVLMRHAFAPGLGDPPGFELGQCATQRNLSSGGRDQARRIGQAFRNRGVNVRRVLASQWCRTQETAELAFPGLVETHPAFNSFFQDAGSQDEQTRQAQALIRAWTGPGVMVVVTHQVNITALTGVVPSSGEGLVVRPQGEPLPVLGRLAF